MTEKLFLLSKIIKSSGRKYLFIYFQKSGTKKKKNGTIVWNSENHFRLKYQESL